MNHVFRASEIPLPRQWPEHVKRGILHAISLARAAALSTRGWAADSRLARVRLAGELDTVRGQLELERRAAAIKEALLLRLKERKGFRYTPQERLMILELRAAHGWSLRHTARIFLVSPGTIWRWMRRLEEQGENALLQLAVPVNRYPDYLRVLVREIKAVSPWLGKLRIAMILARAGFHIAVTTVGRILREDGSRDDRSPDGKPAETEAAHADGSDGGQAHTTAPEQPGAAESRPQDAEGPSAGNTRDGATTAANVKGERAAATSTPRGITSRYPDHTWFVDLTVVPTARGLWCPWMPFALPQVWPFCWWVAVVVDHFSRKAMGVAVFGRQPTSDEVCALLDRGIRQSGRPPKYVIVDKGGQFWDAKAKAASARFGAWCRKHGVKPRFGAAGKTGSIAIMERFIRSLKDEGIRRGIVRLTKGTFLNTLKIFVCWYNAYRPHQALGGATPEERYTWHTPRNELFRYEPRPGYPRAGKCAGPQAPPRGPCGARLELDVSHVRGCRHLPIVNLRQVA